MAVVLISDSVSVNCSYSKHVKEMIIHTICSISDIIVETSMRLFLIFDMFVMSL
jgi:hypothetical protein